MTTLLRPGHTCTSVHESPACGLLVDAADYYREFHKAAKQAKRFIAITGWQFDREVALLRGEEAASAGEVRFLAFLDGLCHANPDLHVYILAWDYSPIYALEREWMQGALFNWTTSSRLRFELDVHPSSIGSHHQKMAIIDGVVAFTGGMDICASRWDDRRHLAVNHDRDEGTLGLRSHGPYHDVQTYVTGAAATWMTQLFCERWQGAGRGALELPTASDEAARAESITVTPTVPLPCSRVAMSKTVCGSEACPPVREIRALYAEAIASAERLIYIENQYFTSRAVFEALVSRMQQDERGRLEIVLVLPKKPEALKEELALGLEQTKLLRELMRIAAAHGHGFGIYCSASVDDDGKEVATYIHSKLLVVDDRLLTVGSANTTNRSMGLDTELNLTWEGELDGAVRDVRVSLLREHAGLPEEDFTSVTDLVEHLDSIVESGRGKLRPLALDSSLEGNPWLAAISPDGFVLDAEDAERLFESISLDPARIVRTLTDPTAHPVPALPTADGPVSARVDPKAVTTWIDEG